MKGALILFTVIGLWMGMFSGIAVASSGGCAGCHEGGFLVQDFDFSETAVSVGVVLVESDVGCLTCDAVVSGPKPKLDYLGSLILTYTLSEVANLNVSGGIRSGQKATSR